MPNFGRLPKDRIKGDVDVDVDVDQRIELREIKDLLKIALDLRQNLPSKGDILHLIRSLELHKPKPIEVEIRNLLDHTKIEVEKLEKLAKNQKSFLEELKTFLSD